MLSENEANESLFCMSKNQNFRWEKNKTQIEELLNKNAVVLNLENEFEKIHSCGCAHECVLLHPVLTRSPVSIT